MLSFSGCSDKGFKYSKYSNGNPKINLSIDYPLGWKCIAYKDDLTGLPTVLFAPADNRGIFNAYVAIEVISPEAFPGKVFTAESLAENIFSRAMKLPKASLDSKSMTSRGEELKVSFDMPETLNKRGAKLLPSKAHIVVMSKGDRIYAAKLMAKDDEFPRYDKAFDHMLKTLKQAKRY